MTSFIAVVSGKGGVGKTTLVSNLSVALSKLGYSVMAVDVNPTTPDLATHLGLYLAPITLSEVIKGERMKTAIYSHPLGFKLVPGSLNVEVVDFELKALPRIIFELVGEAEYVLMDSGAGIGRDVRNLVRNCDEVLVVCNPEYTSIVNALKVVKIAERERREVKGIVLNRVRKKPYELKAVAIEKILGYKILAKIPEDEKVGKSINEKVPVVHSYPNSPAAREFRNLARKIVGLEAEKKGFLERIFGFL